MRRRILGATAALALMGAWPAAAGTYTFDFVNGDPNLALTNYTFNGSVYVPGQGDIYGVYQGGALIMGKGQGGGFSPEYALETTAFTLSGDFTARVGIEASHMNHVCNFCGNQVQALLLAGFANSSAWAGGVADENGFGAYTDVGATQDSHGFLGVAYWQVSRVGDTVTAALLDASFNTVRSTSGSSADFLTPATLYLDFGNFNNNTAANSITYRDFTITSAQFDRGAGGIPEPSTWALMIAGFGGLGAMLRRRRAAPA
jgi:hypothetical protein